MGETQNRRNRLLGRRIRPIMWRSVRFTLRLAPKKDSVQLEDSIVYGLYNHIPRRGFSIHLGEVINQESTSTYDSLRSRFPPLAPLPSPPLPASRLQVWSCDVPTPVPIVALQGRPDETEPTYLAAGAERRNFFRSDPVRNASSGESNRAP